MFFFIGMTAYAWFELHDEYPCRLLVQHGVDGPKPDIFICIGGAICCFVE